MKTVIELKAERAAKQKAFDDLMASRKSDFTAEERSAFMAKFNDFESELKNLDEDIKVSEVTEQRASEKARTTIDRSGRKTEEQKVRESFSLLRALQISGNKIPMSGVEKEVHEEVCSKAPENWSPSGVAMPAEFMTVVPKRGLYDNEKRDLNVTTPGDGGYTVATTLGGFIPVLMPNPIIRNLGATILTGLTGNLDFPRGTNRAVANWEGETDPSAETSLTFDLMQLRPHRVSAHSIVSKQLLIQSSIAMENYVRAMLSAAVAEALDIAAFNGAAGGDNPVGLENISGVGSVVTGGINSITEAMVYEFKDDLSAAFALKGNLAWVMTNAADSALRQLDLATDVGIRLLGGIAGQQNSMLLNYPTYISDLLASDSLIFGNWSELVLGQWGGLDLQVNPYSLDINAQIRITVDSWWDVNVRHAASFSMATDL